MPLHRFHLARILHGLVADIKEYLDDAIDAFDMVEGAGRSAVFPDTAAGTPGPAAEDSASATRGEHRSAAETEALRAELDRLRQELDTLAVKVSPPAS
ncbi:hypothetical protein [Streptomyces qinglanensis]|uniref:Uncharacterized protein n=1 Tax=Streptomyces qinglanensis TaxID=943816 RepID=A0A1H9THA0_9ACTN|nr:hypothetical protein [Streptomyces qinglanensis]SER95993.1 hypothetical protein SAMN05421870_106103 [Streptomyces qinglanensis]